MDAGLIAMRMRLSGGSQVAAEAEVADGAIAKTAATAEAANKKVAKSSTGIRRSLTSQIQSMRSIGRGLSKYVTLPILGVAAVSGKFALDFDRNMRNVNSIAGLPERQFKRLRQSVLDLAGPTAQTPNTLAEGLYDLVSSGFNANEALFVLHKSALAASAGLTTTDVATKAVAAALNAYELPARRAGQVSDQLFETVNRGVLSFDQLATTIGDVLPFASQMGVGLDQVGAAISTMTKGGLSAAESTTRLKNTLTTLLKPGKELGKTLENMGTTGEALVRKKGLQGALEAILATTDGTKSSVAELFPNIRALGGVLALTGIHAGSANADLAAFSNTAGATAKVLAEQEKSFGFQMQRAWADLQSVLIEIGEQVLPIVIPPFLALLGLVRDTVSAFADLPGPVKAVAGGVAVLAALAGPMLLFASAVLTAAKNLGILRATETGGFGLNGKGKGAMKMLGRGAIGVGGVVGAQMAGDAIGGDLGNWTSMAGSGAAAGFAVGGPLGAAVGGAAGGVAAAVGKIKGELSQLDGEQLRIAASGKDVANAMKAQREAATGLTAADARLNRAHARARTATDAMKRSQKHLGAVVSEYGANSRPAIHAEAVLTGKIHAHRRALRQLERAERLRGVALSAYKVVTNQTVLAERHRINVLTDLRDRQERAFRAAQKANPQSEQTRDLAKRLLDTEGRLSKATKQHGETLAQAASKGGAGYARFLQKASQESLRAGGQIKALDEKVKRLSTHLQGLAEMEVTIPELTPSGPGPSGGGGRPPKSDGPQRKNTRSKPSSGSSGLETLMGRGGRPRTVTKQPVQFVVNKRVLAEGVVEVQDDEDARS